MCKNIRIYCVLNKVKTNKSMYEPKLKKVKILVV